MYHGVDIKQRPCHNWKWGWFVAVSRKKKGRKGRPRTLGPKVKTLGLAPSLPPVPIAETPQAAPSSTAPVKWTERPPVGHPDRSWYLPDNSEVRPKAMQIIAMRLSGMEDAQIAKEMGISEKSISPYVYRATRNGWLDIDYDPKQRLQFQLMHKVVRNIEEGLDSPRILATGMLERTAVTLKVAEHTLFKEFDNQAPQETRSTIVQVNVVMPDGPRQTIRADTTGGTPAYIDAEVVK